MNPEFHDAVMEANRLGAGLIARADDVYHLMIPPKSTPTGASGMIFGDLQSARKFLADNPMGFRKECATVDRDGKVNLGVIKSFQERALKAIKAADWLANGPEMKRYGELQEAARRRGRSMFRDMDIGKYVYLDTQYDSLDDVEAAINAAGTTYPAKRPHGLRQALQMYEDRIGEIIAAISRYAYEGLTAPIEWIEELKTVRALANREREIRK